MAGPLEIQRRHRIGEQAEAESPCPPAQFSVAAPPPPYPSARPRSCLTRGITRAQANARGTLAVQFFHPWEPYTT